MTDPDIRTTRRPLPESPDQWRSRVRALVAELRKPEITPCRGYLYTMDAQGKLNACIEGVINDMAIRAGIPADWTETTIQWEDDEHVTFWEAYPDGDDKDTAGSANRALPDALLYHGFDMPEGQFLINALDCDPGFIRETINSKHGFAFGVLPAASLNDDLIEKDVNPLLVTADLLEHLLTKPLSSIWHPRINGWAPATRIMHTPPKTENDPTHGAKPHHDE